MILQGIDQAIKDISSVVYELTLLREEIVRLRKANDLLSRRYYINKRRLQEGGLLTIKAVRDSEAQREANIQLQADLYKSSSRIKQT
jgi:hypothetical protein